MKRFLCLAIVLAACGDDGSPSGAVDARVDSQPQDSRTDGPNIDAPDIDAAPDAMLTPAESIGSIRTAADGAVTLKVVGATVTYIKPQIGSTTNDPAGFTVQATQEGPALFVSVDPGTLTTLTPALAVGDVISFTVTMKSTIGGQPRAAAIADVTRTATMTDVTALAKNVSASTDIVTAVDNYDSELVTFSGTVGSAFSSSGSMWVKASITTAGITTLDPNFQLRMPATLQASTKIENGCTFTVTNTPVGRFTAAASQTQLTAIVAGDIVVNTCPAPTVTMAVAQDATTVKVTFSRALDATTVDMGKFTIVDATMAPLAVSAAVVAADNLSVTLTTATQTAATMYTVTVANTVKDSFGTALGTPATAMFTGFMPVAAASHLVINEVDYNQTGTDAKSFIEIYNPTAAAIPLANFGIVLVNGGATGGAAEYDRVLLNLAKDSTGTTATEIAAGGYLVIAQTAGVTIPTDALRIATKTGDWIQNGPDGVALIDTSTNTLVDALSYGGDIGLSKITGFAATVSLVETNPLAATTVDTADDLNSLSRHPNGKDTDHSDVDWAVVAITPGAANN